MPKVSVLMPTYNQGQYIADSIKSVLSQTFQDYELIILDDCSTDSTNKIAQEFLVDKRVRLLKNEKNLGDVGNINKIIKYSEGEHIKYLFSDDLLYPNALEEFVKVLDGYPDVTLVTSFFEYFGTHNSFEKQPLVGKIDGYEAIKKTVTSFNWIGAQSNVMFRKADFAGLQFEKKWRWVSDYVAFHQLLTKGNLYVVPQFLTKFRQHGSSWSAYNITNYINYHDEYYYLKHIRDNNLYAPLRDEEEFKAVLTLKAMRWVGLIPRFYKEKRYDFLKKAGKAIIEENLTKECVTRVFKKIGRKFYKV